ncbi:MAG: hypothetical protein U1E27_06620, partial [Kiritimatiellia bacterium]|nr:hypothetical protein [Kiritimatiellia bacterium]
MKHRLHTWILNGTFYPFFILATPLLSMILTLCLAVQVPFLPHREVMRRFRLLIRLYGRVVHRLARPWVKIEYDEGPV